MIVFVNVVVEQLVCAEMVLDVVVEQLVCAEMVYVDVFVFGLCCLQTGIVILVQFFYCWAIKGY